MYWSSAVWYLSKVRRSAHPPGSVGDSRLTSVTPLMGPCVARCAPSAPSCRCWLLDHRATPWVPPPCPCWLFDHRATPWVPQPGRCWVCWCWCWGCRCGCTLSFPPPLLLASIAPAAYSAWGTSDWDVAAKEEEEKDDEEVEYGCFCLRLSRSPPLLLLIGREALSWRPLSNGKPDPSLLPPLLIGREALSWRSLSKARPPRLSLRVGDSPVAGGDSDSDGDSDDSPG